MADKGDRNAVDFQLLSSLPSSVHPVAVCVLFISTLTFAYAFYNAFFHPLRHYPGPLLWRSFRIPYVISTHRGEIHKRLTDFHTKYGPVIRVAPNELSYADSRALKKIYITRPGHLPFERNRTSFKKMSPTEPNSIVNWHEEDHTRYRRAFANSFSEKSLKEQAPVIESYVDLFMEQLKKKMTVDLEKWLNYLTFDISGDFTYGESWNCVANGKAHPWVDIAQDFGKGLALIGSINHYPPVDKLLRHIIPKRILQRSMDHRKLSMEQAQKRIALDTERPDWVTPTKKYSDQKDRFTDAEWGINLLVIAFAGSETTASALTAIIRMLVQHRGVLHRLTAEIRDTFQNESDMTVASTNNLPYLNAVINEGMRLGPPNAVGVPRIAPKGGDTVCDQWVPEGTYVTYNQYSAYRQPYNFRNPNSFIPERFLHPKPEQDNMAAFAPFMVGRHSCIGAKVAHNEMRLILARLLWCFNLNLKDELDRWDWGEQCTYLLWDKKPLEVTLESASK